jgi:hypothetical protein
LNGAGVATLSTATLSATASPHAITAVYGGSTTFATSTSAVLSQNIINPSVTTVGSSANPALAGSTVTLTATVSASGGVPTGTVAFLDGSNSLGTGTLNGAGVATLSTATLSAAASPHAITAVYGGSTTFATSTSAVLSQNIINPSVTTVGSSANPALAGSAVTFTATVSGSGGVPTGTVAFLDGSSSLGTGTLNGAGVATLSTATLSAAASPHAITAVYGGSTTFATSTSAVLSQIITNAPLPYSLHDITNGRVAWYPLAGNANDYSGNGNNGTAVGSPAYGNGVNGAADSAIVLAGTQYVNVGNVPLFDFGSGDFTISLWAYLSSASFGANVQTMVSKGGYQNGYELSSFTYGGNNLIQANIGIGGSQKALTMNYSGPGWYHLVFGRAAGTMFFYANTVSQGTTSASGVATSTGSSFLIGDGRGATFQGSESGVRVYARALSAAEIGTLYTNGVDGVPGVDYPIPTVTTVSSSQNPAGAGSSVTLTATVSGSGGIPTGTVAFLDGSNSLGTGTLNGSGVATLSTATLSASGSPHAITAVYGGDNTFGGSTSAVLSQNIINPSATTISSSQNPALAGTTVTLTATVSGSGGVPNGTVAFLDGGNTLGTGTLNGAGVATLSTATLSASASPHAITAVYGGNSTFATSTSAVLSQNIINPAATSTTTLSSSQNPALAGSTVTLTATVSGSGGIPAGTVAFLDGSSSLGTLTLNGSGRAALSTATLSASASPHAITAVYNGSIAFGVSTSSVLSQIITNAPPLYSTSVADFGAVGEVIGFTANTTANSTLVTVTNGLPFSSDIQPDLLWLTPSDIGGITNQPGTFVDHSSAGTNYGLMTSGTQLVWETNQFGTPNGAIHFNGSTTTLYVSNSAPFNFTTNLFSMEFWVNPYTANGYLFQNGILYSNGYYLQIGPGYNLIFGAENGGTDYQFFSNRALTANSWTHVCLVRTDVSTILLYINGALFQTFNGWTNPASSTAGLRFGSSFPFVTAHEYDGNMSEFRIYSYPLTAQQIQNNYNVTSVTNVFPPSVIGDVFELAAPPMQAYTNGLAYGLVWTNLPSICLITNVTQGTNLWVSVPQQVTGNVPCVVGTNNYAAFEAALAQAASSNGLVAIPDGTYLLAATNSINPWLAIVTNWP